MKSIYKKIALILICGFIIEIIIAGVFYKKVVVSRIVNEINEQEDTRRVIMEAVINNLRKTLNTPKEAQGILTTYAKKYDISFVVKDEEGEVVLSAPASKTLQNRIQKQDNIKLGKKNNYIVYADFPARISNYGGSAQNKMVRTLTTIIALAMALVAGFFIYKTLADPLKKLSKAIDGLNYGNTITRIPYDGEDELGVLCRSFEKMGDRLKQSEDNQQQLIQAISHDLKTPLTSIIGYSKRLIDGKVEEKKKEEYCEIIYRKAIDLKSLLEELQDYSNINSKDKYSKEVIEGKAYIAEITEELKLEVERKGGIFQQEIIINQNFNIEIDKQKLKRVFLNIMGNSLKYAGEKCTIQFSCFYKRDHVEFTLQDNGSGVSKEQLEKIFERFYRVESSRSREKGGTGLGLAICQDIIENHGGQIWAESGNGKGLSITFTIPFAR